MQILIFNLRWFVFSEFLVCYFWDFIYPRNEINTPAATAEPITPDILLAIQY